MPQRLPQVNGDDGTWGTILNQFIEKEHYNDGTDNPTANGGHKTITIRPGTTTAGTAPLKFTMGSLMTTPEEGAMEFSSSRLYFTHAAGAVNRKVVATFDATSVQGDIYYLNPGGAFTRLPIGSTGNVLTVVGGMPAWAAPTGGGGTGTGGLTRGQVLAITTANSIM
jgi:hypothetical protein